MKNVDWTTVITVVATALAIAAVLIVAMLTGNMS